MDFGLASGKSLRALVPFLIPAGGQYWSRPVRPLLPEVAIKEPETCLKDKELRPI